MEKVDCAEVSDDSTLRAHAINLVIKCMPTIPPSRLSQEDIDSPVYAYFNTLFSLSDVFVNYLKTGVADLSNLEDAPDSVEQDVKTC